VLVKGDIVSVLFNTPAALRQLQAGQDGHPLRVNPARPGAAYGYGHGRLTRGQARP
jgi:hypothetical protein